MNFSIGPPTYGHFPPSRAKPTLPCPIQIPSFPLARSPSNHHTNKHLDFFVAPSSPSTPIQSSFQEIRKIDCCRNLPVRRPIAVRKPLSSPADSTLNTYSVLRLMRALPRVARDPFGHLIFNDPVPRSLAAVKPAASQSEGSIGPFYLCFIHC